MYNGSGTNNCEKGMIQLQGFLHTHTQQERSLPSFSLDATNQSCKVRMGEWNVGGVECWRSGGA